MRPLIKRTFMAQPAALKEATRAMLETANDLCARLPGYRTKAMFGGFGMYADTFIFGVVAHGEIYMRIGEDVALREDYAARGSHPFSPDGTITMAKWWSLPTELYDDPRGFLQDAKVALALSQSPPPKPAKTKRTAKK